MLAKTTPPASREDREFCAFSVVYISREHYSFRSTGHVAMVRFKFQLTDRIFKGNNLEDDFEDEMIGRIFGYKFVLYTVYSFESGEEI